MAALLTQRPCMVADAAAAAAPGLLRGCTGGRPLLLRQQVAAAEVTDAQPAVLLEQQVVALEVPVHNAVVMHMDHAL